MYLKVPYNKNKPDDYLATVTEVEDAINKIAPGEGLTVEDETFHFPSIDFPEAFPYKRYKEIESWLNANGFEAY